MKKLLFLCFVILTNDLLSQSCINTIAGQAGSSKVVSGGNCLVKLCVSVSGSPRPKQIQFELSSPVAAAVGMCQDRSVHSLPFDCGNGGAAQFADGVYCHTFTLAGACPSTTSGAVRGYTNGSGGGGGLCNTVTYSNVPLPVSLTSFDAKIEGQNAVLNWTTSEELNNKGFEIQKSIDAINFDILGFIDGSNTAKRSTEYQYIDKVFNTTSYYRLGQKDFDGSINYSRVLALVPDNESLKNVILYPNPNQGMLSLQLPANTISLIIARENGTTVLQKTINKQNLITLDVSDLSDGIYQVLFITPLERVNKKLVIVK